MFSNNDLFVSTLFKTLDKIKGTIDIQQLRNYIYTLFLYKYISDEKQLNNNIIIDIPENSDFSSLIKTLNNSKDLGEEINTRLHKIAIVNPMINGVIDYVDFNQSSFFNNKHKFLPIIKELLHFINSFTPNNNLSYVDVFDSLMQVFNARNGKSGDITTPKEVCELIAKLIKTKNTNNNVSIYDPTCSNGNLIITVSKLINSKIDLFGQDINSESVFLTKLYLIIHGIYNFNIERGDILSDPKFIDGNGELKDFDIVVSNPPFNLMWDNKQGQDRFSRWNEKTGIPPRNSADYAFILHIIKSLKINGVGACIISNGALFRGGNEKKIRKHLIDKGLIKGIIGLPAKMFLGTGIPCSIIIFENQPNKKHGDLFIIDASTEYSSEKFINKLTPENIERIVDIWSHKKEIKGFSRIVKNLEIADNDYNLNLSRYLLNLDDFQIPEGSKTIALSTVLSPAQLVRNNNDYGKVVKVSNLLTDPFSYTIDPNSIEYGEVNQSFFRLNTPALLVSKRFNRLKPSFCLASLNNELNISSDIYAFEIDDKSIDLSYLILQLNSDYVTKQIESYTEGSVMPSLRRQDFLKIEIVVPDLNPKESLVRQKSLAEGAKIQSDKEKIKSLQLQKTIDTLIKERLNDFQWQLHDIRNGELLTLIGKLNTLELFAEINPSLFNTVIDEESNTTVRLEIKEINKSVNRLSLFLSELYSTSSELEEKEDIDIFKFIKDFCTNRLKNYDKKFEIDFSSLEDIKRFNNISCILISFNKKDLISIFSNIFDNAINHGGFENNEVTNRIKIDISLNPKKQLITIGVWNNGKESNISEIDYFSDGGKAGLTARSGKGGHIIKQCAERNDAKVFQKNYKKINPEDYTFGVEIEIKYKK